MRMEEYYEVIEHTSDIVNQHPGWALTQADRMAVCGGVMGY